MFKTRKKPVFKNPRYSKPRYLPSQPGSLRSKLFKFMVDYPLSTLTQATNYFQDEYSYKIHDLEAFKLILQIYRHQYWAKHGKPYAPPKKQLEAIRKGYDLPIYSKNEFKPIPEVVEIKKFKDEQSEVERLNSIARAIQRF